MPEMKAVQFDRYGDVDVLELRQMPRPSAGSGKVVVEVKAAGINIGEASIRKGLLDDIWPATFPSGEGSDLAGVVVEVGTGVAGFKPGDEVLGFTNDRASHAESVVVPAGQLTPKPSAVPWEVAGGLSVAGRTAYACVHTVELGAGDVVAIANATGSVGTIAVQLARRAGATVLGIAGSSNDDWLASHGAIPVNHGDDLVDRLRDAAPDGRIDAFLDLFGGGYVEMAVNDLGLDPERVNTIIDFEAAKTFGAKAKGGMDATKIEILAELAKLIADDELEVPVAGVYPLAKVRDAYRELEERHTRGKIVLCP